MLTRSSTIVILIGLIFTSHITAQSRLKMIKDGGVYTIPCEVNGLKLRFIFDTGASDVSISLAEAAFMLKNGYLDEADILGSTKYQIANGEIVEGTIINLKQIKIGSKHIYNVKASIIHSISAPLLLGQSALSKIGEFSFDYSNEVLTIGNSSGKINNSNTYSSSSKSTNDNFSTYSTMKSLGQLWREPRQGSSVKQLSKGKRVRVIGYQNGFWRVYVDGFTGYVYHGSINVNYEMDQLKRAEVLSNDQRSNYPSTRVPNSSVYTTMKSLGQLWREPKQGDRVKALPKGKKVMVIGYQSGFWKVSVDGLIGFVYTGSINVTYDMNRLKS